jgi:hypothetical protein
VKSDFEKRGFLPFVGRVKFCKGERDRSCNSGVIPIALQNFTSKSVGGMRRLWTRKPSSFSALPAADAFWP